MNIIMHGVRIALLEWQAEAMGMPRESAESSNEGYETSMQDSLSAYNEEGVSLMAFGDLFLEDLPVSVGPCSETGEFHALVQGGPNLIRPVLLEREESAVREGSFYFCRIIPF